MLSSLLNDPLTALAWLVAFVVALTFHEFSHALVAKLQGDDTAERMGRLTLNPVPHIDPIGLLAVMFAGFGWAKPVPYNSYNLRDQRVGPVLVAAAGPLSNLVLFLIAGLAFKGLAAAQLVAPDSALWGFLSALMGVNVVLFAFNLIPIPPLDGSKVLLLALQHPRYNRLRYQIESQGPSLLIMLILADALLLNGVFFGTLVGFFSGLAFRLLGV